MCVCCGWKRGKKEEEEFCFELKWVVEKPARPLGAERGGACGVWDSRQRRHIHTDTGSVGRKKERQAAGERRSSTPGLLFFVFWGKKKNFVRKGTICVCQLHGFMCEGRDVCVGAAVSICFL